MKPDQWASTSTTPKTSPNGGWEKSDCVMDQADQWKREKEQKQLRHAQKMEALGTLAGGIAHQLNNVLTTILGFAELALDEVEKGTPLQDHLMEIFSAGNRARDLVQQILVFSRTDGNEIMAIEIPALIKGALNILHAALPSSIEIKPQITKTPLMVEADPSHLHQIVINLLSTAGKAIADGSGTLGVRVDACDWNVDNAPSDLGIKPGYYARITVCGTSSVSPLEPLDDLDGTPSHQSFAELGLLVNQELISHIGGHIVSRTQPGNDVSIELYLPATQMDDEPQPAEDGMVVIQ